MNDLQTAPTWNYKKLKNKNKWKFPYDDLKILYFQMIQIEADLQTKQFCFSSESVPFEILLRRYFCVGCDELLLLAEFQTEPLVT